MRRSREDDARLDRLASEVRGGGGLPLPSFFTAILEELLDNGPTENAHMVDIITSVGVNKKRKVAETWGGSWEYLTADLMEQLASVGYVTQSEDKWSLADQFRAGVLLKVIPERKGLNVADSVLVRPSDERENLRSAKALEDKVERLIRQPRGRVHPPDVLLALRKSAETHGRLNPILVTGDGRILDGRHRNEIDPTWPRQVVTKADGSAITEDADILAAIRELEAWRKYEKLSDRDVVTLDQTLDLLRGSNAAKRARVEAALREDAARSNRAIAEATGVSDPFVMDIRELLTVSNSIHRYITSAGRGGGNTKHSADCWCGEGDAAPPTPKPPTQGELIDTFLKKLIDSGYQHRKNEEGREKLVAALQAETGITRSHGALEQRWDKLAPSTPVPPPAVSQPVFQQPQMTTPTPSDASPVEQPDHQHRWRQIEFCDGCGAVRD